MSNSEGMTKYELRPESFLKMGNNIFDSPIKWLSYVLTVTGRQSGFRRGLAADELLR
jgi:hypothetical protein